MASVLSVVLLAFPVRLPHLALPLMASSYRVMRPGLGS